MEDRQKLLESMMKDLLDAVGQLYGQAGLGQVVTQMKRNNRAREDRQEIDALEAALARVSDQ